MATREEKQIRLELPSTSGVECEIRESLSRQEYVFTFFQNERVIKTSTISHSQLTIDQMVDLLSDAGVEFFSFSAIFDVAELLLQTVKDELQQIIVMEEDISQPSTIDRDEIEPTPTPILTEEVSTDAAVVTEPEARISIEYGDKLLKKFKMPYSKGGYAGVYYSVDGKYAIILFQNDSPIIRKKFAKENINEDNLVALISGSGIEFLSFSAIYETAETIQNILLHPEEHLETDITDEITPMRIGTEEHMTSTSAVEIPEDEIVMVDLSSLDVSEYSKAEDFDKFISKVTSFVNEGHPLPVKEFEIEQSGGAVCIILRQMDSWYLRFRARTGSLSEVTEVKLDQDEIARLINQEIPQISFSYLYDASEKVFLVIQQLAKRPIGDVILNVAVGHFMQIIEQQEAKGDLKAAGQITEVLLERFRKEKNLKGIIQFGKKLLAYYEEQKKDTDATKLRNSLTQELLEIDTAISLEFVLDSVNSLERKGQHLNAANLCGLILDHLLTVKFNAETLKQVITLGRKQVDFYKSARLPSVMEENAVRYAHYTIKQMAIIDSDQITPRQKEIYHKDIIYLLDQAFESQEERNANFELLESLENTLDLLRETNDKITYSRYIDRLIITLETQNRRERALEVAVDSTKFLLDSVNYVKACEYGNKAIKLFYELERITEAIDFSVNIVRGLVDIKETNAAQDYIKFIESLVNKAYETDDKSRVEKHLIIGDLYGKLGLKDQAKAYIQAALQTIGDAKKREKIVLEYVNDLLESHATLSAQEMVNQELSRLLTGQKIEEVIKFCQIFIKQLQEYNQRDMVFEYMKYCSSLMIQTEHTDYKVIQNFIKDLQDSNELDRAAFIENQLLTLQKTQKDYTRAIDGMGRFIDHLVEKSERFDLIEYYIRQIAVTYREMGDTEGAIDILISFQKRMLDHSVELAQRIIDEILKELEKVEDYKKSISIVSPLIDKLLEQGNFQDAYIFSVQNARYYERLGDIGKVIQYLEDIRDKFIEFEQFEDANRMTDLILRFGRSHQKYKLAITAIKEYSKNALDRGDTTTSTKFALETAALLEEENQVGKALEFLQMIFNSIYEKEDKESALQVFQRIMEIRGEKDDFKKIVKKYLDELLRKYPDVQLLSTASLVLKPPFEDWFSFSEVIFDHMLTLDEVSNEIAEAIINFVNSVYGEGWLDEGDRIANKYATLMLDINLISYASRLMAIVLERSEKPVSEVIPSSVNFINELIQRSLLENAREYADRIITMITSEKKFGRDRNLLAGKIAEKFAVYVASENPDLASEYVYQASTYYRSLNDFDGVVAAYTNLAKNIPSPERVIRTFKRGIKICQKFKADKHEAKLLFHLTEYLIANNNVAAFASFQQTLEKFEELQDLNELFDVAYNLIEVAIKTDNLKIAYTYLDYLTRLSSMIDKEKDLGGIIVFLLRHAEEVKDVERIELIQKYVQKLDIRPKKFSKEYSILAKQRMAHVSETFERVEAVELEEEPEPIPELVETEAIVPPKPVVTFLEPSQELLDDKIDEEFASVIKEFGEEIPKETAKDQIFPVLDEVPLAKSFEPSLTEAPSDEKSGIPDLEETVETRVREEPEIPKPGALTDEEIRTLFSSTVSPRQETPPSEPLPPLKDVPPVIEETFIKEEFPKVKDAALSEAEMDSLFIPRIESPSIESQSDLGIKEEETLEEDEWEVDSFGRLWKKGTLPPSKEELTETEELPNVVPDATPDLTPLESLVQEQKTKEATEDIAGGILEEALSKPSTISTKKTTTFDSVVDALTKEEETVTTDIFDVPKVDYNEITQPEETKESQVKIPDLADLFSDALSELGGISGKVGEIEKKKKK